MKKSNRPPKSKSKLTKSQLAVALGISRQALNVHLKTPGHPPIDDIAAWEILLAERGRAGTSPPKLRDAIARERLAILKEEHKKRARENRIAAKELISYDEAKRQVSAAMALIFSDMARDAAEFPPALSGRNAVEIGIILTARIEKHRKEWAEKFEKIGT
jgi:hypothetical protein